MTMDKELGYNPETGCLDTDECIWCLINTAKANMKKYEGTPHEAYWRSRYEMLSGPRNKKEGCVPTYQ